MTKEDIEDFIYHNPLSNITIYDSLQKNNFICINDFENIVSPISILISYDSIDQRNDKLNIFDENLRVLPSKLMIDNNIVKIKEKMDIFDITKSQKTLKIE